ncbi:MAG: cobalt-precorrin-5B (C(1))-methyltransferase CbiD [Verrucomicrobiae bacterium]|nr:cobalt-precorrin-5B (C(1))-methyltransferase CbiD [Verrucomicrobiae bacterium]
MSKIPPSSLRAGFSTGACAAAASVAAWRTWRSGHSPQNIRLLFPDGKLRRLAILKTRRSTRAATTTIRKDAGDDIDITHRALIQASLSPASFNSSDSADFILPCGSATLILRGGKGVGKVTRPGLDVPPGHWAINPVPRRMILDNLRRAGLGRKPGTWQLTLAIPQGVTLARRTLNPTLGIVGGLSILGTSGIVIPCSHQAYLATIRALLRGARAAGCDTVILATGGRTHRAARRQFPRLPETAFIRIGDFFTESIAAAIKLGFRHIIIACMAGKLAKYAQGIDYTHARAKAQSMADIGRLLRRLHLPPALSLRIRKTRSMREFLENLDLEQHRQILKLLACQTWQRLTRRHPSGKFTIMVFDAGGKPLARHPAKSNRR